MLNPSQSGYLRRMPDSGSALLTANAGPTKAMWNKFVKAGLAEYRGKAYRRTDAGDRVLRDFDLNLAPRAVDVMIKMLAKEPIPNGTPGLNTLSLCELVNYGLRGCSLTYFGERYLASLFDSFTADQQMAYRQARGERLQPGDKAYEVHMNHCGQGEHEDSCKYGCSDICPAL